jgi:hypothetical protein
MKHWFHKVEIQRINDEHCEVVQNCADIARGKE